MVALDHIVPTGIQRVSIADGRIRTLVAFDSGGLRGAVLSPDERQLAYVRLREGAYQLVVSDTSGGNVRVLVRGASGGTLWSPTGQHIAYRTDLSDIRIVEVATQRTRELVPSDWAPCPLPRGPICDGRLGTPVVWRSDARAIRYFERRATSTGRALQLREVDLDGRQRVVTATTVSGSPSFITGNDTLFLVRQPNAVHLVSALTGTARVLYSGAVREFGSTTVDASGQWILLVGESGGVHQPLLVSLTTGESKKYPYALGGEISHGTFLPDGGSFVLTACVSCRDPEYVEKWDLILTPMNGDPPRILTGSQPALKDFWPIAVTRDGRTVFFSAEQSYNTRIVTIPLPKL
jgi:hypothetical protein